MRVNSQTTQFSYDGDGNLVKKNKPDGSCTIYPSASLPLRGLRRAGVGGVYEVEKAACGGAVTHTRVYYPAGGAMKVDGTLYFVLKDHLGSRNTRKAAHSDEFFKSELIDWHPYEAWMNLGKPTMYLNAREKVKSVLAAPLADPLSENVLKTLDDILAAADNELG